MSTHDHCSTEVQHTTPMANIPMPAQSTAVQAERFQSELIAGMTRQLLRTPAPPCMLRAPTGSGKTFVISQVLERVSAERDVLWFWFVPFVTLVQQTEDALLANATNLTPCGLTAGRNQEAHAGMVLLSTAQGVARAQWRTKGYDADGDDDSRTLAAFVARAKVKILQIGLIVDEAHIGVDTNTEFGKFAHWLQADYVIMATATPKDARLNEFLTYAGYAAQVAFPVSRDVVVEARLNKKYIEAVVYNIGSRMVHVTDLRRTVLRQSWLRNLKIQRDLAAAGIQLTPLLLVQVANGDKTVDEAADDLIRLCGVPPEAIGRHTSDKPDPVLMAAIANNTSYRVLIFKQAAGTGFDAPRAFVLASTKTVNDADFAMQFIGRVMRVARPVRDSFAKPLEIPPDLNTAYVYLGNAQAQAGFEAAVKASAEVKSQLEGQTEKLETRQTVSGAVVYTNRSTDQEPIAFYMPAPDMAVTALPLETTLPTGINSQVPLFTSNDSGTDLWGSAGVALDRVAPSPAKASMTTQKSPGSQAELIVELGQRGLRAYPLKRGQQKLGRSLKTEAKPELMEMTGITEAVAMKFVISETARSKAIKTAFNLNKEIERHTELTTGEGYNEDIHVITDRSGLAREAMATLRELPHAEEEDYKCMVQVLANRLQGDVDTVIESMQENAKPSDAERRRMARDAAHWVIRDGAQELREAMFNEVAKQALLVDAQPLPDIMVFPEALPLEPSPKNIYGVLPPSPTDTERIPAVMVSDDRAWFTDRAYTLSEAKVFQGHFDDAWQGNKLENLFSRALDKADFVVWWHRNPRNKPYSVRVVRAEHEHYFYPDFVVCVEHSPGEDPIPRLLETKDDLKDAQRKAKHWPDFYGKVLFLTPDGDRMRWIKDGHMSEVVDLDDMQSALEMLVATRPAF